MSYIRYSPYDSDGHGYPKIFRNKSTWGSHRFTRKRATPVFRNISKEGKIIDPTSPLNTRCDPNPGGSAPVVNVGSAPAPPAPAPLVPPAPAPLVPPAPAAPAPLIPPAPVAVCVGSPSVSPAAATRVPPAPAPVVVAAAPADLVLPPVKRKRKSELERLKEANANINYRQPWWDNY